MNGWLDFNIDNVGMAKYSQEVSRFVNVYFVSLRDIGRNGMGMFFCLVSPFKLFEDRVKGIRPH